MKERIIVMGAGIAGLGCAMALASADREIVIVDRDPPPPQNLETAFETWERKGVTQLRHSHVFLGKLFSLIRDRHPKLMQMLKLSGVREFDFEAGLPATLRDQYAHASSDADLSILFSRRTTLEHVMRDYAVSLGGVTFVTDAAVRGLITVGSAPIRVLGLTIERDGQSEEMRADAVVDASGRYTLATDWLREAGATIAEEESPAGILYFTRHYKLNDGQEEPPRDGTPGAGDLGYIKFGVFPADNRHFSITLAVPEIELAMRTAVVRPETFDAICMSIPGLARWIDPSRATPVTKVFSMGNLVNLWKSFVHEGKPVALGFFAVGDAAIRTNPLYGRGCSSAVMHAHVLADVLDAEKDPTKRALTFAKSSRKALRPFWEALKKQDMGAIKRAKNEQNPDYKPRLRARIIKSFAEDAVVPATRGDITVLRAIMKGFHMLEAPALWLTNVNVVARVLAMWATPKSRKAHLYPPKLGPNRAEMLMHLGLKGVAA